MPLNGHAIRGTPIAVDLWDLKKCPQARIFFLSHFHGDLITSLTNSWKHPIYCSPITAKFLTRKLHIDPSLVIGLELYEDHEIPLDPECKELLTVTLLDANHCPGAVMFLLTGYFGDILYTADFRYEHDMFGDFSIPPINMLYLDNTYCLPKCCFPKKEDAMENALQQVHNCLVHAKRLYVGIENLGKEEVLVNISKERHCKIHVNPSRKEAMDILGLSDIFTTNQADTKIFVVPIHQISQRNIEKWNAEMETHAILLTAQYCGYNFKPYAGSKNIHVIPYSSHSSYEELIEFVQLIKPTAIVPIVGKNVKGIFGADISARADMNVFKNFLRDDVCTDYEIPETVLKVMNAEDKIDKSISSKPRSKKTRLRNVVSSVSDTPSIPDFNESDSSSESELSYEIVRIRGKDKEVEKERVVIR